MTEETHATIADRPPVPPTPEPTPAAAAPELTSDEQAAELIKAAGVKSLTPLQLLKYLDLRGLGHSGEEAATQLKLDIGKAIAAEEELGKWLCDTAQADLRLMLGVPGNIWRALERMAAGPDPR